MDREMLMLCLLFSAMGDGAAEYRRRALKQMISLELQEELLQRMEEQAVQAVEEQCRRSRREIRRLSEEQIRLLLGAPPK
ncbi:hypothetical protein [Hominifimenecus sp. rT4P-3]|uniref:hypothetical protein n=1 Tax=Hominifimenecus sp. rT4P-3 TaxID=3242979 RepID=UPI003DA2BEF1